MNPAALSAWAQQNKTAILLAGAGVAVTLGVRARSSSKPEEPAPNGGAMVAGSSTGAPVPVAGYAAYDSSASDLYNAVQPGMEAIGQMVARLEQQQSATPTPVPAPEFSAGYYQNAETRGLYHVDEVGNRDHITADEWAFLSRSGAPAVNTVPGGSAFWGKTKPIGAATG
jgi:hypothetical protein